MWKATLSKCTDGEVWIVKTPGHTWEYLPFPTEEEAQAYAAKMNAEEEREREEREAEEAERLAGKAAE